MIGKLSPEEIEELLKENIYGHLGCNDGFNTYVYPINYVYDGKFVIAHSQTGAKIQVMRDNPRVCLQVDEVENHTNWKSVMIHGEYQELTDERERNYAMKAFVDRRLFLKISEPGITAGITDLETNPQQKNESKPTIYRIVIDEKSGRYENE